VKKWLIQARTPDLHTTLPFFLILLMAVFLWAGCSGIGHSDGDDASDGTDALDWKDGGDNADEVEGSDALNEGDAVGDGDGDVVIVDGDGANGADNGCPEQEEYEKYCINPNGYECDYEGSFCRDGQWQCITGEEHPPAPPGFDDWAWRCRVYICYAWNIPEGPGEDWQEEQPYTPPDPATLTGEWRMAADSDSIVPIGCERQPRQYAEGASLAVDPTNPDVMYVGFYLNESYPSNNASGVFKSVDGGRTWFEARAGLGSMGCVEACEYGPAVYRLYMDNDNPQVLFASTTARGIYRTTDGARTWQWVNPGGTCVFAGPVGKGTNGIYHAACEKNLFRSLDGGDTWEKRPAPSKLGKYITSIGFDKRYPDRVWLGMSEGEWPVEGEGFLFLSDDGGETWTEMGQDIDTYCHGQGAVRSIAICTADPDQMAVSVFTCGLFLSENGGLTWYLSAAPLEGAGGMWSGYAPLPDRCRLYSNNGESYPLSWTEDGGKTWEFEFQKPLVELFFNPFSADIIVGILKQQGLTDDSFELWIRE